MKTREIRRAVRDVFHQVYWHGFTMEVLRPVIECAGYAYRGWFAVWIPRDGETRFMLPSWESWKGEHGYRLWSLSFRAGVAFEVIGPFELFKARR